MDTSTSSTFDEEWEYKKGWQSRLNLVSPSQWTKASKANEGGEVALYGVTKELQEKEKQVINEQIHIFF